MKWTYQCTPWWWPSHGRNICRVNWTKYENKKRISWLKKLKWCMYIYLEVVSLDGWRVCRLTLNNNRSKILKCVCFVLFCYMSQVCDATNHPDTDKCAQKACLFYSCVFWFYIFINVKSIRLALPHTILIIVTFRTKHFCKRKFPDVCPTGLYHVGIK